jgi:hypothetical protein
MCEKKEVVLDSKEQEQPSKMHITIFMPCLIEDIKEVMKKHGVPQEFHVLQLTRALTEMLITTKS